MRAEARFVAACVLAVATSACGEPDGLAVLRATYGASCGVPAGNVSWAVAERCQGAAPCTFEITPAVLGGDPAEGCEKDFEVAWACGRGPRGPQRLYVPGSASLGKTVRLACD
jgi:hypothetical protein